LPCDAATARSFAGWRDPGGDCHYFLLLVNRSNQSGVAPLVIVAVLALIGIGAVAFKPKWFHGDSQRAATSQKTTEALLASEKKLSAQAAASVTMIGQANTQAPESPVKEFIAREVPVALAVLEPPDPMALVAAEKRKNSVLEGKIEVIERLYGDQAKIAESLRKENAAVLAEKRRSDAELAEVAAERLGAEKNAARWLILAVAGLVLYVYVKLTHIGPGALAEAVSDMRKQGATGGIVALDGVTSRLQQSMVRLINKLKTHPDPEPRPPIQPTQ